MFLILTCLWFLLILRTVLLVHMWCWYCRADLFWRTKDSSTQDVSWACPSFDKVQNSVKGLLLCENPWFMIVWENSLMIMEMLNRTLLWEGCCYPDAAVPELCPSHTLTAWCQEILAKGRRTKPSSGEEQNLNNEVNLYFCFVSFISWDSSSNLCL